MIHWTVSKKGTIKAMINPNALLGLSLATASIINITGKQTPEWLTVVSLMTTVVAIGTNLNDLIINETTIELDGYNLQKCNCVNRGNKISCY